MKTMKTGLLAAVASAALIAGAGVLSAQDKGNTSQNLPQAGGAAETQGKGSTSQPKAGAQVQGQGSSKTEMNTTQNQPQVGGQPSMDKKGSAQAPDARGKGSAEGKAGMEGKAGAEGKASAEGRGSDKGSKSADSDDRDRPRLDDQQRTRISTSIRSYKDVRRVDRSRVNFNISVGVAIPRSFTLYPLPAPILAVVPAYRGYLYIVVGDDLLIVHPRTYEIVAVIPA